VQKDLSKWSGEGTFTQSLVNLLGERDDIDHLRVEDAPATRSDADYNFISNELYVVFSTVSRTDTGRRFGLLPIRRTFVEKRLSIEKLAEWLAAQTGVGAPDYKDEGMIQYLRTERIVPPYQTRGYKLVELVRIYEAGVEPRR
jgi:hypothetical protein